jgi:dienelactone hydrolase
MRTGIIAAALAVFLAAPAAGQVPNLKADSVGRIEFDAPTYVHYGAFRAGNSTAGRAAMTIWLPPGNGPFAAVIIGHSIGGWSERAEGTYVKPLLDAGYAVLGLDHFGPRGIKRAADVPGAFSPITAVSDALLALKLAATHPRIDRTRVGVMGLSMGGITSELTGYEFVRRKVLGDSPLKFAAHVPFYAPCGNVFSMERGPFTTGAPMLKLYGGKDETTPRDKCARIDAVVRAAEPGLKWQSHWYEDAYHAWENAAMAPPRFFPGHVNASKCPILDFGSRMRFIDVSGAERPYNQAELQACIKSSTGYSMGYSESAAKDAPQRMLAFFAQHLRPR